MTAATLLIYDIPSDRLRTKVANACLDYGLERIQLSAFQGSLTHNRQEELLQRIRRIMGPHAANVQLFPVCEKDVRCSVRWVQDEPSAVSRQPSNEPSAVSSQPSAAGDRRAMSRKTAAGDSANNDSA